MKRIIYIASILSVLNICIGQSKELSVPEQATPYLTQIKAFANTLNEDKFKNWTEEQYKHYEDSIQAILYPPVIAIKADSASFGKDSNRPAQIPTSRITNSHVPNSISLSQSNEVGQIVINSGTSSTGARTYEVPIDVYPGMRGFNPQLSLSYNSQQGNSVMGVGWSASGLPMIARGGKTMYYEGKSQGIVMDNSDAFMLNGIRLIKTSTASSNILYESEQGNIKVKGYVSGNIMKYFEVFYPDGNKGIFGYPNGSLNYLYYPLISLTDLKGNKISYSYSFSNNHYNIVNISYNGASVEFNYQTSRPDPILYFAGGLKVNEPRLLQSITCKLGSTILGTYTLKYTTQNNKSLLTQIDYTASGKSYNPLLFYYGRGNVASNYTKSTTQLYEWYVADNPSMIKVAKGKFDYDSGADGLIALPNLNPYWKHYRNSTMFRHSQNRFDNMYTGEEKIFLYAGLKDSWASPMPNLFTEKGFVDIVCADLEGKQEEYVIKINNSVVSNNDQVVFHVYRSNLYSGLSKLYTRTYNFPTVYTDADDGKSIQPKFYYTGDFNGDGKMEILAVSVHQPFGDTSKPSKCYIFDLAGNSIIYQNHVLPYNVEFVGTQQSDPKAANNNTDKLFVMDYDGDGKTDICHINESGVNIYTFDVSGSTLTARKVATYTGLKKSGLANRDILLGEYNGDGLMDLLVSPTGSATTWTVYNSKGNGQFESTTFNGTTKNTADNTGFIIQDINGDGVTDLIKYDASGFFTYLANNNNVGSSTLYSSYPSSKSILIPTDINTRNCFTQLISLKDGIATKFAFSRNDSEEAMATGMANSLGIIEKNDYRLINEEGVSSGLYTKGYGATYPYVNIQEPLPVIASSEIYMNGNQIDNNSFTYNNAVIHRQGLGFRGFEKITIYNSRGQSLVRTYEPYRYGLLKSEVAPAFEHSYTYTVSTQANKIAKILLTNKIEKDLLKDISATTSYIYDSYGYPTEETISYNGDISVNKSNTYSSKTTVEDGYNLGFLTKQLVTVNRGGSSYTEQMYIPVHSSRLPIVKVYYKDGNQVKQYTYTYDSYGNPITETIKLYTSLNTQKTSYEYDSYGRLSKVTSPMGLSNTFTYNTFGQVATVKDYRGGTTAFTYDAFGRETAVKYPDNTSKTIQYAWSSTATNGLYSITTTNTGKPTVTVVYDALNREVRKGEKRFDGIIRNIDKLYDSYGNLQKESMPFTGSTASLWNTYAYDSYNRILSCTESSGRKTTYSYNKNNITMVSDKVSTTKAYDAQGNLLSVTDPAGTIVYNLAADGQPYSVVAPGNIVTSFSYDKYRRQTNLIDPSQGTTTYEYDAAGNVAKETNANGKVTQNEYDSYNRLIKTTTPEFVTSFTYNAKDELTGTSTNNGTSKSFAYDSYGRLITWKENGVDGKWLQKDYTYSNGNVSSIKYTSQSGVLATENYVYSNGHLSEAKLNGTTTVFKLSKENSLGQPTEIVTGGITRKYDFNAYGLPVGRSASSTSKTYQDFSYVFDATTSNLTSRKDDTRNITENFGYDNLNRLTSYAGKTAAYDVKGNITSKSDAGTFEYTLAQKPYAVSGANLSRNGVPTHTQEITYTSFGRPESITENGQVATFTYNGEYDRVKMNISQNGNNVLTRYYLGNCYELDQTSSSKEKLYLFGDFYDAGAVYIKEGSSKGIYYILRDYLGSITHIVDSNGALVQELSYDAWGRLRNPVTQEVYTHEQQPALFLGRGYTGHEHLTQFGLVNMNARLYDPILGRFLSPDPYVQMPYMSQNFNRYTYAMNNPLCYVDEDGESIVAVIGIIVGAYVGGALANNGELNPVKWNYRSASTYLGIGFGALTGGVVGYGIAVPGSIAFAGGISTPYLSAGLAVGAVGQGSNWKFDFHWSTAAGGGGGITNTICDSKTATEKAIKKVQWDYSAFQYATAVSTVIMADDVTGIGIADDVLIPAIYGYAAYEFMTENMVKRQEQQIIRLSQKNRPGDGFLYQLKVKKDGFYKNVRTNSLIYMKQGDVWKYGETTQGKKRYNSSSYEAAYFEMHPLFYGTKTEILIQEKIMLYWYYFQNGQLPPGNKRFQ